MSTDVAERNVLDIPDSRVETHEDELGLDTNGVETEPVETLETVVAKVERVLDYMEEGGWVLVARYLQQIHDGRLYEPRWSSWSAFWDKETGYKWQERSEQISKRWADAHIKALRDNEELEDGQDENSNSQSTQITKPSDVTNKTNKKKAAKKKARKAKIEQQNAARRQEEAKGGKLKVAGETDAAVAVKYVVKLDSTSTADRNLFLDLAELKWQDDPQITHRKTSQAGLSRILIELGEMLALDRLLGVLQLSVDED